MVQSASGTPAIGNAISASADTIAFRAATGTTRHGTTRQGTIRYGRTSTTAIAAGVSATRTFAMASEKTSKASSAFATAVTEQTTLAVGVTGRVASVVVAGVVTGVGVAGVGVAGVGVASVGVTGSVATTGTEIHRDRFATTCCKQPGTDFANRLVTGLSCWAIVTSGRITLSIITICVTCVIGLSAATGTKQFVTTFTKQ